MDFDKLEKLNIEQISELYNDIIVSNDNYLAACVCATSSRCSSQATTSGGCVIVGCPNGCNSSLNISSNCPTFCNNFCGTSPTWNTYGYGSWGISANKGTYGCVNNKGYNLYGEYAPGR